jgi:hypothetical protein
VAGKQGCFFCVMVLSSVSAVAWSESTVPSIQNVFQMSLTGSVAADSTSEADSLATADLGEIDRKLNNPLTDLWSLTFQNNTNIHKGDLIDGREVSNNLFFQPFLPFAIGDNKETMLTFRPVFPLVTNPVFGDPGSGESTDHDTGLGDTQLLVLAGPNVQTDWVWGVGSTFKFPTATEDTLGSDKYQMGPGRNGLQHWQALDLRRARPALVVLCRR